MGKKRRMLSATKKFAKKHSQHPRMVMLNNRAAESVTPVETLTVPPPQPPVTVAPAVKTVLGVPESVRLTSPTVPSSVPLAARAIDAPKAPTVPPAPTPDTIAAVTPSTPPKLKSEAKVAPKTTKKTPTRRRKTTKKKTNNTIA